MSEKKSRCDAPALALVFFRQQERGHPAVCFRDDPEGVLPETLAGLFRINRIGRQDTKPLFGGLVVRFPVFFTNGTPQSPRMCRARQWIMYARPAWLRAPGLLQAAQLETAVVVCTPWQSPENEVEEKRSEKLILSLGLPRFAPGGDGSGETALPSRARVGNGWGQEAGN